MEKIHINLGKDSYDIVIDSGLIRHAEYEIGRASCRERV